MNEEQTKPEQPDEAPAGEPQKTEAQPREVQSRDPRRRLRELLAVPERDRSDAVWDEIAMLEIELAPGNRINSGQGDAGRRQEQNRGQDRDRNPEQARRQAPSGGKPAKRFSRRPKGGPRNNPKA